MTSSHHAAQYSRYSVHPPPPPPSDSQSLRLPSLKDLNFPYRSPHSSAQDSPSLSAHPSSAPVDVSPSPQDHPARHVQSWARSNPPPSVPQPVPSHPHPQHHAQHPHQQHTPPLSAGHEVSAPKVDYASKVDYSPKVDYPTKHENGGYAHPGMPMSAQMASSSVNQASRVEESAQSPSLTKRPRPASSNMSVPRDVRPPHAGYPPQYASYPPSQPPPTSPHYQISPTASGPPSAHPLPPPPTHEQLQQHAVPVATHPGYGSYHPYMQARPAAIPQHPQHSQHPQHPQHPPHQPPTQHNNPYPSPGPPPSAPPPQGPWIQHHQPPSQAHHSQHPSVPQPQAPPPPPSAPPQQQQQQQQQLSHQQQHQQHQQPQAQPQQQHPQHQQQHVQHPASMQAHPPPSVPSQTHAHMVPQQHHHQQQHQQQQQHPSQVAPPQPAPQHHVQQQHAQLPFGRTTALVPTPVEARGPYPVSEPDRAPSARNDTVSEIVKHCTALYTFASRYAQLQASIPHAQPTPEELVEMSQRAATVVRLLEEFRRMNLPDVERAKAVAESMNTSPDDPRPPKRPWEDISQGGGGAQEPGPLSEYPAAATGDKTTAEQDMEIIRTKRATSTAGGNGTAGQPKSKYRKRSRATPPGKCHSCNIRETPEWRRGPDGARTLCNACGLHYAKLMRKKDKAGETPVIDMETLRASAKAAENLRASTKAADLADRIRSNPKNQQNNDSISMDSVKQQHQPPPQQIHQSSFQVIPMMAAEPAPQTIAAAEPRNIPPPPASHPTMTSGPPPPPWSTSASGTASSVRPYPDHLQHQSFMRTSQHPSVTQASPR